MKQEKAKLTERIHFIIQLDTMLFHSKQNETIIAVWAETAEHSQLTLSECWFSIIKVGEFGICHFFYLNQHTNLFSSESITKHFSYKWQTNWQEFLFYKCLFSRHKQFKYRSYPQ